MAAWATLLSRAGPVSPPHQSSGGTVLSRRVPWARSCDGCTRASATPQASTATAHQRARRVSTLRQHGSAYVHQGLEADDTPSRARQVTTLATQAKAVG